MTTYTPIVDGQLDQDSPITQPLMEALRDNPIAIAEGAAGAPRVQGIALGGFYLGRMSGATGIAPAAVDVPAGVATVVLIGQWANNGLANYSLRVRYSGDGGVSWTGYTLVDTINTDDVPLFSARPIALDVSTASASIGGDGVDRLEVSVNSGSDDTPFTYAAFVVEGTS